MYIHTLHAWTLKLLSDHCVVICFNRINDFPERVVINGAKQLLTKRACTYSRHHSKLDISKAGSVFSFFEKHFIPIYKAGRFF